jgi:hypothetical protein
MPPRSRYRGPKTAQRAASHQTNGCGLENQSRARPFLPIDGHSNRNQNGPRPEQTRCRSDNLLPHPFETINLRRQLAYDATTDTQDAHDPTSLNSPDRLLARYYSGHCEWIPASNGDIRERSCSQMLVWSRFQNRQVLSHEHPTSARLAQASGTLRTLVNQLETEGSATDDTWESAIETMLSFANESAWLFEA